MYPPDDPTRPFRPKAGQGLVVIMMMVIVMIVMMKMMKIMGERREAGGRAVKPKPSQRNGSRDLN